MEREAGYKNHFIEKYRAGEPVYDPQFSKGLVRGSDRFCKAIIKELETVLRLPATLSKAIKLRREGALWGLKALLSVLCKPAVHAWQQAMQCWEVPDGSPIQLRRRPERIQLP